MTSCFEYRRLFPIPENSTTPVKKGRPKELKFDIPQKFLIVNAKRVCSGSVVTGSFPYLELKYLRRHSLTNQSSPLAISSSVAWRRKFGTRYPGHALFYPIIVIFPSVKFLHQIHICLLVVSSKEGIISGSPPDSTPTTFMREKYFSLISPRTEDLKRY